MRVVLIDDERLALEHLGKRLGEIAGIEVIGKYSDPYIGLKGIKNEQPDAVFLDIEMPGVNGLDLAKEMKQSLPNVKIIFTTAYREYAVDAFEVSADDYLLKPIMKERLIKTINRLLGTSEKSEDCSSRIMVCCFHKLHFKIDEKKSEVIDVYWRTTKAREVFAYLLHHRAGFVRKVELLEHFWPESNPKDGLSQLYSTIYQIRKTLKSIHCPIKIVNSENAYRLDLNGVLLDVDEWEFKMKEMSLVTKEAFLDFKQALDLYKGDYFEKDDFWWTETEQNRLRLLWLDYVKRLADFFIFEEDYIEAIMLYLRAQKVHPFEEDIYFMLMQLYDTVGERDSVIREYKQLKDMLQEEFGSLPSEHIQKWHQNWEKRTVIS